MSHYLLSVCHNNTDKATDRWWQPTDVDDVMMYKYSILQNKNLQPHWWVRQWQCTDPIGEATVRNSCVLSTTKVDGNVISFSHLKNRNVYLTVVLDKSLKDHRSAYSSPSEEHECVYLMSWLSIQQLLDISLKTKQMSASWWHSRKNWGITKVIFLSTMDICTKLCGIPFNSFQDMWLQACTKVDIAITTSTSMANKF